MLKHISCLLNRIKKNILFAGVIYITPFCVICQNLILNPSCENVTAIPEGLANYDLCYDWWNPFVNSTDLFSTQTSLIYNNWIPSNAFGHQDVDFGDYYLGINTFDYDYSGNDYIVFREDFAGGLFSEPLKINTVYQFGFYVNRAEKCEIASNALDVVLTYDTFVDVENVSPYGYKAWSMESVLADTIGWTKITFCFKANGQEKAFAIGNFHEMNQVEMLIPSVPNQGNACNYLYLDNFSLIECPTCCPDQFPPDQHVYVFSSPSAQNSPTSLQVWLSPNTTGELKIYDSAGRLVAQKSYAELENNFVFENFAAGIYHFALSTSDGVLENGKVMVNQK